MKKCEDTSIDSTSLQQDYVTRRGKSVRDFLLKSRTEHLWRRLRVHAKVIGRLTSMNKEIKMYGSANNFNRHSGNFSVAVTKIKTCLFLPDSKFKLFWDTIMVFLLIYTATLLPYRMCFSDLQTYFWQQFDISIDFVFFLDVLINFNSVIYSKNEVLIFNRWIIAKEYLKSWFIIDFLSCLPIEYLDQTSSTSSSKYNQFLRILKVSKVYRFIRIVRLLKLLKYFRVHIMQSSFMQDYLKYTTRKLCIFVIALTLIVHNLGCIWFYIGSIETGNLAWIYASKIEDLPLKDKYIASIYYVFSTLTTVGYGDIVPTTNTEKIFAMCMMGFGVGSYSIMIGSLSSSVQSNDQSALELKAKLRWLTEFTKAVNLSTELKFKIKSHIKANLARWDYKHRDVAVILKALPCNLREEVLVHLYQNITNGNVFFEDKPQTFINSIAPQLKLSTFKFDDNLYEEGDIADEIYFIKTGKVHMKVVGKIVFRVYLEGSYFGEVEVLKNTTRDSTASIGSNKAEIFVLSKTDFLCTLSEYPDVMTELKEIANLRQCKHDESKAIAMSHFRDESEDSLSLMTESENSFEKPVENGALQRKDTSIMISLLNDTAGKRKNRKIWSKAVGKTNAVKVKRSSTTVEEKHKRSYIGKNIGRQDSIKNTENERFTISNFCKKSYQINEYSPIKRINENHLIFDESDIDFSSEEPVGLLNINHENTLSGITNRECKIDIKVRIMQLDQVNEIINDSMHANKDLKSMIEKLIKIHDQIGK